MKNSIRSGLASDLSVKIDWKTKKQLANTLAVTNIMNYYSLTTFIYNFLEKTKKFKNAIIKFQKPGEKELYALLITPGNVRLAKNYNEIILRLESNPSNKSFLKKDKQTIASLQILKSIFEEILFIKPAKL
ncbi:MAG: hypothetical protein KGI58_03690 [Patescibacteria group bacterium]|nr:hypothetical protein [Patescibacteria group bacterium]